MKSHTRGLGKTMSMPSEISRMNLHQCRGLSSLALGKFQSWDRYLAACEGLITAFPKRKEGGIVEAFMDGIYDDKQRRNREKMLDERGGLGRVRRVSSINMSMLKWRYRPGSQQGRLP